MILWTGRVETEAEVTFEHMGRRSWRWVLLAERDSIGLQQQYTCEAHGGEWGSGNHYVFFGVSTRPENWHFGMHHTYCDGPHHALWLGPLWLNWTPSEWCTTCMPDDPVDYGGIVTWFVEELFRALLGAAPPPAEGT